MTDVVAARIFGRDIDSPLVQVHSRILALALFNHHLHLEHHAYPKVPLARLAALRPVIDDALEAEDVVHIHIGV